MADTRAPLHNAKGVALDKPTTIYTDGMKAYPAAIAHEFAKGFNSRNSSPHKRVPSICAPESNNLVERLQGTEKERMKVMRGIDNQSGTGVLMEGFRAHYNLVRDHQTPGKTPGAAEGLPSVGGFRWYEILKQAAPCAKKPGVEVVFVPN